jgi:peptide/nickel transport system permease protein
MRFNIPIVIACTIGSILVLTAVFAPFLAPYNPIAGSLDARLMPPFWQEGGSTAHILGTDLLGRDVLSRLIYGARTSLFVCVVSVVFAGSIGSILGIISGYFGGWVDIIIMRIVDLALSIPTILLALVLAIVLGPSFLNIIIVISLILWSQYARMARGETLKIKNAEYVDLAKVAGRSPVSIMIKHILPNVLSPLIILATLQVGSIIILESSLSFLGVGVPPPTPSWGHIIAQGRSYIVTAWWLCVIPGIAIMLTVLSFNLLGDALNDFMNPVIRTE